MNAKLSKVSKCSIFILIKSIIHLNYLLFQYGENHEMLFK